MPMSDLSANSPTTTPEAAPPVERSLWLSTKKAAGRLQDWFAVQSIAIKITVAAIAVLIAATAAYSVVLMKRQAAVAEQVKQNVAAGEWVPSGDDLEALLEITKPAL